MAKVPLSVILRNENKLEEMSQILEEYMRLVPSVPATGYHELPNHSVLELDDTRFFQNFIWG